MDLAGASRVLIISLGNPSPYLDTLHSAGHHALEALRRELILPAFSNTKIGKKSVKSSADSRYTLVQSPTLMNVSGRFVFNAWKDLRGREDSPASLGLIILHDDLEEDLGDVKIRSWTRSHRGHNGLKSINSLLRPGDFPGALLAKISVGIGRPDARDQTSVSDYVLRPMTSHEESTIANETGSRLLDAVGEIERQWVANLSLLPSPPSTPPPGIPAQQKQKQKQKQKQRHMQKQEQEQGPRQQSDQAAE